jgi:hypothetical protein
MKIKSFCSGLAVAGRLGQGVVMLGGLLLSSIAMLAQGLPKPPPPPPPSSVVNAVQSAANQAGTAVTGLTADQKQKAEEAKRQLEAQMKAAVEALKIRVNQRVIQLNTFYSDQRKSRQTSQKTMLSRKLIVKAKGPGLATAQRVPVAKTTPASGGPTPRPMPGGTSSQPASAGSGAAPAPAIANLSATSGEPGDPILVTGTGFTPATEVYFLVAPNRQEKASVGFSGDTQLMVEVPLVRGIPAFSGLVLVKREDGQVSQGSPFRFTPRTVVVGYLFENNEVITDAVLHDDGGATKEIRGSRSSTDSCLIVSHSLLGPMGFKVDDILFPNTRLKNGWIVEDVVFNGDIYAAQGRAELREFGKGTAALKMKVHGWTIAAYLGVFGSVGYSFQPLLRGPEGLSYK